MRSIRTSRRMRASSPSMRARRRQRLRSSCMRRRRRISRCAGRRTASGSRSTRTRISPTTSGCGRRRRRRAAADQFSRPRRRGRMAALVARRPLRCFLPAPIAPPTASSRTSSASIRTAASRRAAAERDRDRRRRRRRATRRMAAGQPAHRRLMKEGRRAGSCSRIVSRDGGDVQVVHRFASEHDTSGLGVSPGRPRARVHRAGAGWILSGVRDADRRRGARAGHDRSSNKTQPAWSPDGGGSRSRSGVTTCSSADPGN